MWATIPFLITMIVALLTITYVPALTEVSASMSPYDPGRSGRIADLTAMLEDEIRKLGAVGDIELVTSEGVALAGKDGKPIHRKLADCAAIKDVVKKDNCEQVFVGVKNCRGQADRTACEHKAIACWVADQVNASDAPIEQQIVLFDQVPLKSSAGAPTVKKLADCAAASDVDACRELFLKVSNCRICPPDGETFEACRTRQIASWIDANADEPDAH
jgi:hypothetical protein